MLIIIMQLKWLLLYLFLPELKYMMEAENIQYVSLQSFEGEHEVSSTN